MILKEIASECGHNLEVQSMVLKTIRDFKQEQAIGMSSVQTMADMVNTTVERRSKKNKRDEDGDDSGSEEAAEPLDWYSLDEAEPLRRGQLIYAKWAHKQMMECLSFMDETCSIVVLKNVKVEGLRQIMEFVLDIRCHGDKLDRVGSEYKSQLYNSLRMVYQRQCSKLGQVVIDNESQMPDWSKNPAIQLTSQVGRAVQVTWSPPLLFQAKVALVELAEADNGPWNLHTNCFLHCAVVKSETHEYPVLQMFPAGRMVLTRRVSEELGATISADEHQLMLLKQKQK